APVSAILSAALLPTVLLIAWRCQQGLAPALGFGTTQGVFILFGLASITVAVPFLGQTLAFKRILAYSSLEHMGIIALGIGFASPLALAGVTIHLAGHAVAKALGFSAMIPLLSHEPRASRRAVTGVGRTQPALGAVLTLSLGALAGLPPSPLFVSELLIVAGGFQSGHPWAAGAATVLVALAFLGLLRTLLTTTAGEAEPGSTASASATASATAPASAPASAPATAPRPVGLRSTMVLASICAVVLIALAGGSAWLPTTDFANALMKGIQ
ncbi:MAG: hypothetical protein JXA67_10505, partial [Micromonosporaceae bacterium]|nr:hypothetical protein [Micromonosporaceae bacterium]